MRVFMFAAAAMYCWSVGAVPANTADFGSARAWIDAHAARNPAFSFRFGGKSAEELLPSWKKDGTTFSDPATGLLVRCEQRVYDDFPAIEWTLCFKNTGAADTPLIEAVQALDAAFDTGDGPCRLRYSKGSHEMPSDFEPQEKTLDAPLRLVPYGGRSSDGVLPFFNLVGPNKKGVILGIGWTGQWAASFDRQSGGIRARAGMDRTHFVLHPGEEVRTPAILLMFWAADDPNDGNNLFRRLLLKHYTPKGEPPLAASPHGAIGFTDTTESNMVQGIENIAANKAPLDTWWIDAGWHGTDKNWAANPGTWDPNPEHFPRGLKPVGDAAHAHGMRFLLWCEPERVMRGTWLYEHHRHWLLAPNDLPPALRYQDKDGFYLLDLGNPAALDWCKRTFSQKIREYGIDIYRQDFNMTPLYFWRNGEPADREGLNETRYITGLYDLYDTLLRDHPGLIIDNCASGGRRIDFEIMRRAFSLFRSDCCWDPIGEQCMMYGISPWMPVTGVGAVTLDPYAFRSGMGSHMSLALNFYSQPDLWPKLDATLRQYLRVRHLFKGDFYPLTPYTLDKDKWIAYQFDVPETGEGLIQAFRRESAPDGSIHLNLRGLDPAREYVVEDLDAASPQRHRGRELMENGLDFQIATQPGAKLIYYHK